MSIYNLQDLRNALDTGHFKTVVIDLISELEVSPDEFKDFKDEYPDINFIEVYDATKDGNFKGSQKWMHYVDIQVEVYEFQAYASKRCGNGEYCVWPEEVERRRKAAEETLNGSKKKGYNIKPGLKPGQIIKELTKNGWSYKGKSNDGSHLHYVKNGFTTGVPNHKGREVSKRTIQEIKKQIKRAEENG